MLSLLLYLSVQEFPISVARIYFIVTFVSGMFNNTKKHWLSIYVECILSSEAILYSDQIFDFEVDYGYDYVQTDVKKRRNLTFVWTEM